MEQKRLNPAIISIIVIVLIAIAAGAVYAVNSKKESSSTTSTTDSASTQTTTPASSTPETTTPAASANSTATTSSYKDGTYTATGNYSTPGGPESIKVTVTLAADAISTVNATGSGGGGDTAEYQAKFLSNYKSAVVGKSINSVQLSRVAGSSLTSNGFNSAIEKIKSEATS